MASRWLEPRTTQFACHGGPHAPGAGSAAGERRPPLRLRGPDRLELMMAGWVVGFGRLLEGGRAYPAIVDACCAAWNRFAERHDLIFSVTSRHWAEVNP